MAKLEGVNVQTARKRRRRWREVVLVVLALLVIGGVVWGLQRRKAGKEQSSVHTAEVKRGEMVQTISSNGVIAAETGANVKIGSQITGRIRVLNADVGQKVQAGQIIAVLDAPDLAANLESARRNLAQAQSRYQQQLAGVSMQHTQVVTAFEQAGDAVRRAEAQRDQARAAVASAQARLRSSQAALSGAQARQKSAEAALRSAQASARYQPEQTSAEVARAQAALSTAQSNQRQVQKSADLQIAASSAALKQAESQLTLAQATLQRQESLLAKGYVAPQEVDTARNAQEVARQQVESARAALALTREQVAASLQAAADQVTQAEAALAAARAGIYQDTVRAEAVAAAQASLVDAQAAVAQAQTAVAASQAELTASQAQLTAAQSEVSSAQQAQKAALANLTQDQIKQKEVQTAYEAMRQAQAQVQYQEAQFDKSNIRTPISGTVVSLTQQQGETVAAGLSAPTLVEVVDLTRLEAHVFVDETDIAKLQVNMAATVNVDAYPDRRFQGRITKISSAATIQDNVVTYQVTVGLEKYPEGLLKPQMTCDVSFTLSRQENVLLVPNEALKQADAGQKKARAEAPPPPPGGGPGPGGPGAGGGPVSSGRAASGKRAAAGRVVVVLKNGQPEIRPVTTGDTDGTNTVILKGVEEGEKVVLAGFEKLGLEQFSSAGRLPGLLTRGPLGTGGSATSGGRRQ